MKYFTITVSVCLLVHDCLASKIKTTSHVFNQTIDTTLYYIAKYNSYMEDYSFHKKASPADLSNDEIVKIEELIDKRVAEYDRLESKKHSPSLITHPEKYYKQIVAVINSNGEKEVWVNCFCFVRKDWKKGIHMVADGGSCYFNLEINLSRNNVYGFYVNTPI